MVPSRYFLRDNNFPGSFNLMAISDDLEQVTLDHSTKFQVPLAFGSGDFKILLNNLGWPIPNHPHIHKTTSTKSRVISPSHHVITSTHLYNIEVDVC